MTFGQLEGKQTLRRRSVSAVMGIYLENIHQCLWFRSAVQCRWSVPNRIPVGFLSGFSQGCSTVSSQRWQSRIPKPKRGHVGLRRCLSLSALTHTHTHCSLIRRHAKPTTTRHPNVSVSCCWRGFRNLELSQVIPNYLNLQNVDVFSHFLRILCRLPLNDPTKLPHSQTLEMLCEVFLGGELHRGCGHTNWQSRSPSAASHISEPKGLAVNIIGGN